MNSLFFHPPKPRLFGHRGSASFPENTVAAFQDALDAGLLYLELDVWCAKDGEVMVHHDQSLSRICGVDRSITELTGDEIEDLDAGFTFSADGVSFPMRNRGIRIPTLEQVLLSFRRPRVVVEIKQDTVEAAERVVEIVRQTGSCERVLLASQFDAQLKRVRILEPEVPTNLGVGEVGEFYAWLATGGQAPYAPLGNALQIPPSHGESPLVSAQAIKAAHALNLEMHVWTVNDAEQIEELLALGVDGIMSDYPTLLRPFLPRP